MLGFASLSNVWQHLPGGLRGALAAYVGQRTLIIMILCGVTDTHINKQNRAWIEMMQHNAQKVSHKCWRVNVKVTGSLKSRDCDPEYAQAV